MNDVNLIEPRGLQRQVQRFRDVPGLHRRAELPGNDVAREVVQYRAEVKPAPADHLEIGEVGLPKLVWRRGLVLELIGGFHDNVGGTGDQVVLLQQAIDRSLRDKIVFRVREACRKFPWRQLRLVQGQLHDLATDIVGDAIPDALRQMGLLNQPDDLQLFGSWIPHSSLSPSAIMLFLSRRNSRACSATTSFSARASRRRSLTSPLVAARAVSPAKRRLPASRNSFDQV